MQCWRHLGLHPSEPTRSFSLRSWPAYSRVLLLALCGAFEGSSSSLPPTQPLKEGPSGIGSRNKRALVRHRWALAVGAIGTFHGRNKGKKGFVVCSLVLPRSRCRESRGTCLGAAHLEWNQEGVLQLTAQASAGPAFRDGLSATTFSYPTLPPQE